MKPFGICMGGNEEFIKLAVMGVIQEKMNNIRYVEIGIGEGKTFSAVCELINSLVDSWKGTAIDLTFGWSFVLDAYNSNVAEFGDKTELLLMGSPKALDSFAENSIDIAFIDGDHSEKHVLADFKAVDRCLTKGGLVIFHDTDEASQGLDVGFGVQIFGIQVRDALKKLGVLSDTLPNYSLILDYDGDRSLGGRGIVMIKKVG